MSNKSVSTISTISDYIYCLSNLIFFIILIISYTQINTSNYGYLLSIGKNWNNGPLLSIDSQGLCDNKESTIITEPWPGTNNGCYCSFSLNLNGPLRSGLCVPRLDNMLTCRTISSIPAINFKQWRGKNLCGPRMPLSYLDMTVAARANSCPFKTRSCGVIDSLNNVMCVDQSLPCPLNELKFIGNGQTVPTDKNYTSIDVKGGKILTSNQNVNGKILDEFSVSDRQPCADPDYKNLINPVYKLNPFTGKDSCKGKIGDYVVDNRWTEVDSYNSFDLLKENNIYQLTLNLPLYPNQAQFQHDVNLYSRNYIGLNPVCLQDLKNNGYAQQLIYDLLTVGTNINYALSLALVAMILGIIVFVVTITYFILMIVFKDSSLQESLNIKAIITILPTILCIVILILCSITSSYLRKYSNEDYYLGKKECVDDLTYLAVSNFKSGISTANTLHLICIAISVLNIMQTTIQVILRCCAVPPNALNESNN